MRKTRKILILLLLYDALAVFAMQMCRWAWAWIFVALYWALLTTLNYCNWRVQTDKFIEREQRTEALRRAYGGKDAADIDDDLER